MANQDKVSIYNFYQTLSLTDFSKFDMNYFSCIIVISLLKNIPLSYKSLEKFKTTFCPFCPFKKKNPNEIIFTITGKKVLNYCHFSGLNNSKYWIKFKKNKKTMILGITTNEPEMIDSFKKQLLKEFPLSCLEKELEK